MTLTSRPDPMLQEMRDSSSRLFDRALEIYQESFPHDERRSADQLRSAVLDPLFVLLVLRRDDCIDGLAAIWKLPHCTFLEHLAIAQTRRMMGLGTTALRNITGRFPHPVVLEAEPDDRSDAARRRIGFYERAGFHRSQTGYVQPAYDPTKKTVPMILMSFPRPLSATECPDIVREIYQTAYGKKQDEER